MIYKHHKHYFYYFWLLRPAYKIMMSANRNMSRKLATDTQRLLKWYFWTGWIVQSASLSSIQTKWVIFQTKLKWFTYLFNVNTSRGYSLVRSVPSKQRQNVTFYEWRHHMTRNILTMAEVMRHVTSSKNTDFISWFSKKRPWVFLGTFFLMLMYTYPTIWSQKSFCCY